MRFMQVAFLLLSFLAVTSTAARAERCPRAESRPLFIWAEWPELYEPSHWKAYFDTLLGFTSGNCGNFEVPKIVLRVTKPEWDGLFTVSKESSLYKDFLVRLPPSVELRIYPYMFTPEAQGNWTVYSDHALPLDGVFKYAHAWNQLLSREKSHVRIRGIVTDGEERHAFDHEQRRIPHYKRHYGIPVFAVAIGFECFKHMAFYPHADEYYMEMYDWYHVLHEGKNAPLIQTSPRDTPETFLAKLHKHALHPFVARYGDPRFHFMWSVQAKSKIDCIFPLNGSCGSKDDFGWFTAAQFNQFLGLIQEKYPTLARRSHGLFQFNFVPPSWL